MPSSETRYYFDTNALWKYYKANENEKGILNIRRLVANSPHPILISPLTLLEFIDILTKNVRQKNIKQS